MIEPILIGCVAAGVVVLPVFVKWGISGIFPGFSFYSPVIVLGVGALAMVLHRFVTLRRGGGEHEDGMADLFVHIHSPFTPDSPVRWVIRGIISFLLAFFGAVVGAEGAAIEFAHSIHMRLHSRFSKWFEQRRRTDASVSLSAGIAASFGTPFAAVLLPMELGVGGRIGDSAVGAVTALLLAKFLRGLFPNYYFNFSNIITGFTFSTFDEWKLPVIIGIASGIGSAILIRFVRYADDGFSSLFQTRMWMRALVGAVLLSLVLTIYHPVQQPTWYLMSQALNGHLSAIQSELMFFSGILGFTIVIAGFGTVGLFWPLFMLGGLSGIITARLISPELTQLVPVAGIIGGSAWWGAVLGVPLAGALLAYELTQNLHVLFPCLLAGLIGRQIRTWLRTRSLSEVQLESRGIHLIQGRSAPVLESITVREAMVTDFEVAYEHETISALYSKFLKSSYPFIPVVNQGGIYRGVLTFDMVQESLQLQKKESAGSLDSIIEAKDLLYRSGFRSPTIQVDDRLSAAVQLFQDLPCIPVLTEERRVGGLLFVYQLRLAYDREVARRSFFFLKALRRS